MSRPNKYKPHQGTRECERRVRQSLRKRERALDEIARVDSELLEVT